MASWRGSATAAGALVPAGARLLRAQARAPRRVSQGAALRRPGTLSGAARVLVPALVPAGRVPAPALVPAALILAALAPAARAALLMPGGLAPLLVVPAAAAAPCPFPGRPAAASSSRRSVSEIRLRGMSTPSTRTRTTSPDFTIWCGSDTKVRDIADTCTRPS